MSRGRLAWVKSVATVTGQVSLQQAGRPSLFPPLACAGRILDVGGARNAESSCGQSPCQEAGPGGLEPDSSPINLRDRSSTS